MNKNNYTDPITLIPKLNKWLVFSVCGLILVNALMAWLYISQSIINQPKSYVYRLYDNPSRNELFAIDHGNNGVLKTDVEKYLSYIVGIYDFQSQGSIRYLNFSKFEELTETPLKEKLAESKTTILGKRTNVKLVDNKFISVEFNGYKDDPSIILAKTRIETVIVNDNNTADKIDHIVTFAFKKVNRKFYLDSSNIGGKFYGLTLVGVSDDILSI